MQKSLHVMNIEDNPAHAMLLRRGLFQTWPLTKMTHALDGSRAMTMLAQLQDENDLPDIILLDLHLPGASGFEILQEIKSVRALVRVPVVIVSTSDNPSDIERAFDSGADDYLVKPQTYEELLDRLTSVAMKFFRNYLCDGNLLEEGYADNVPCCQQSC